MLQEYQKKFENIFLKAFGWLGIRSISFVVKRSLKNASWSSVNSITIIVLWFVSTPILVKKLGVDQFGIWQLVRSISGFAGIADFGLSNATIRYISKYRTLNNYDYVNRVASFTLTMYAGLGLILGTMVFFFVPPMVGKVFHVAHQNQSLAIVALKTSAFIIFIGFVDSVFQSIIFGYERYDVAAKISTAANLFAITGSVFLAINKYSLISILMLNMIVLAGSMTSKAMIARRILGANRFHHAILDRATFKEIFNFGFFSWGQSLLGIARGQGDKLIVASLLGTSSLTYYTVSLQAVQQIHSLLSQTFSFLFPLSSTIFEEGNLSRLKKLYRKSTLVIILFSSASIIPLFICSYNILYHWMGADFAAQSTLLMRILSIRFLFLPISIVVYNFFLGTGQVRFQTLLALLSAPIEIIAMWILIPPFGLIGAAISQLFALPIVIGSRFYLEKRLFFQIDWKDNISYLIILFIPLLLALLLISLINQVAIPVIKVVFVIALIVLLTVFVSIITIKFCQKLGLMRT